MVFDSKRPAPSQWIRVQYCDGRGHRALLSTPPRRRSSSAAFSFIQVLHLFRLAKRPWASRPGARPLWREYFEACMGEVDARMANTAHVALREPIVRFTRAVLRHCISFYLIQWQKTKTTHLFRQSPSSSFGNTWQKGLMHMENKDAYMANQTYVYGKRNVFI